jgi:hypothetical protein
LAQLMSMLGLILVAQAAAPAAMGTPSPDIEIRAQADIRSVRIRSHGTARLTLRAEPGDAPPIQVERSAPAGASSYRNLRLDLHAIARLTAPEPIKAIVTIEGETE